MRHHATDALGRHHLPSVVWLVHQDEDAQGGQDLAANFEGAGQPHALQALENTTAC